MISKEPVVESKKPVANSTITRTANKESKLKGGSEQEIDDFDDEFLDEILRNKNTL